MAELRGAGVFTVGITTGGLLVSEHGLLHPAATIVVVAGTVVVLASERCSRHLVWIIRELKGGHTDEHASRPENPPGSPPPGPSPQIPTIRRISRPGWVQRRLGGSSPPQGNRRADPPPGPHSRSA
jgi:hypothetical protein